MIIPPAEEQSLVAMPLAAPAPSLSNHAEAPSAVKEAILSLGESDATSIASRQDDRVMQPDPSIAFEGSQKPQRSALEPPDPAQFTTGSRTTPPWLKSQVKTVVTEAPVEQVAFERPPAESVATTSQEIVPPPVDDIDMDLPIGEADDPDASDAAVASDFSDSSEGWLSKARDLSRTAQSANELAEVTLLCRRTLDDNPPAKMAAAASRLAAWAHNRRGELLGEAGDGQAALAEFQSAVDLDPTNALAIHNRAVTYAQENDFDAALADFNRVIELHPGLAIAYRNRGELLAAQGKIDEAVADYTRAIEALPDDAELYRARAHALQRLDKFENAMADLDRAIQAAPRDAQSYTQRANLLADRGEYARALDEFTQSLAIDANQAETHRGIAWLKATCPDERYRDAFEALSAARAAIKLSPQGDYLTLDALAAAHANASEFDKAVAIQQQAISAAPADAARAMQARLELYQQRQPFRASIATNR
jgi:tetratricopeptide (TPR) repeat protein